MMTFKDLKKLVELPSYKEQRVPTVKALEVSGVPVVAEKILENHGSISVYQIINMMHWRVRGITLRKRNLMNTSGTSVWFWKERIVFS